MAERVKVRRLSDEEGQRLLRIVRRGEPKTTKSVIRYRRAMVDDRGSSTVATGL